MLKTAVIVDYARSPYQFASKGELAKVRPDEMAGQVVRGLLQKTAIATSDIEDLILGCAFPEGEQGYNIARLVAFLADLPLTVAGTTVNRFCGSSMQAIHMAAGAIAMNAGDVFICAGVESMSRVPMGGYNLMPHPELAKKFPQAYMGMGMTAENLADKYDINRSRQQELTITSHQRAAEAQAAGRFVDEIISIRQGEQIIDRDGCIRPGTSVDALAGLKPAFKSDGSVTAGTSSPMTDGASAVLVTSEEYAKAHGLNILAKIRSIAVSGCEPDIMGIGPVASSTKALERAGLTIADMDIIELNEAFAVQALACMDELGVDSAKTNIDGGALALGHPLGATGARITGKAASLLKREGGQFALASQCIGGGQGIATILEAM